jgi:hypothetical protein
MRPTYVQYPAGGRAGRHGRTVRPGAGMARRNDTACLRSRQKSLPDLPPPFRKRSSSRPSFGGRRQRGRPSTKRPLRLSGLLRGPYSDPVWVRSNEPPSALLARRHRKRKLACPRK